MWHAVYLRCARLRNSPRPLPKVLRRFSENQGAVLVADSCFPRAASMAHSRLTFGLAPCPKARKPHFAPEIFLPHCLQSCRRVSGTDLRTRIFGKSRVKSFSRMRSIQRTDPFHTLQHQLESCSEGEEPGLSVSIASISTTNQFQRMIYA